MDSLTHLHSAWMSPSPDRPAPARSPRPSASKRTIPTRSTQAKSTQPQSAQTRSTQARSPQPRSRNAASQAQSPQPRSAQTRSTQARSPQPQTLPYPTNFSISQPFSRASAQSQPSSQPSLTLRYLPGQFQPLPCYRSPAALAAALQTPSSGRSLSAIEVWDVTTHSLATWTEGDRGQPGNWRDCGEARHGGSRGAWEQGAKAGHTVGYPDRGAAATCAETAPSPPWQRLWQWGKMALTLCFATVASPSHAAGWQAETDSILAYGSEGEAVAEIQYRLRALGYLNACITGFLGSETTASIAQLQRDYGLVVDGVVGPETQAVLFSSQDRAMGGEGIGDARAIGAGNEETVARIQELLQDWGYYGGPIDAIPGPITLAAIRQFQADQGLVVDGIVGEATWQALMADSSGNQAGTATGASGWEDWELPPPPDPGFQEEPIDPLPAPFPPDFS